MRRPAFTLVELLVVIAIIGLLSTVAVVALSSSKRNAANAKRKADLVQVAKALELYYSDHDKYPNTNGDWYGNVVNGGNKEQSGPNGYVPDLAPQYIGVLPRDPNVGRDVTGGQDGCTNGWAGNFYRSNETNYMIAAVCVVDGGVSASDPFARPVELTRDYAVYTPDARSW
jgi:prepilin-type N-terminal cleavage/methylation domain-containing protein